MVGAETFNWPYPLQRVKREGATVNQTTGAWVPATETVVTITGSVRFGPSVEEKLTAASHTREGEITLFTSDPMEVQDQVRVHLDNAGTYDTYRVVAVEKRYGFMQNAPATNLAPRVRYRLEREDHA